MSAKNIHEAIVNVRKGCPYIRKDGQMDGDGGKYSYAQLEDVIHHTRPLLDAEQVTIRPIDFDVLSNEPVGRRRLVMLKVRYELYHVPSETSLLVIVPGEGADFSDKACNKALAAAEKLAVLQAFYIERGNDDPDKYPSLPPEDPFVAGKGESAECEAKALDAMLKAPDIETLDKYMEAARKRAWTQEQFDRIRAAANSQFNALQGF